MHSMNFYAYRFDRYTQDKMTYSFAKESCECKEVGETTAGNVCIGGDVMKKLKH